MSQTLQYTRGIYLLKSCLLIAIFNLFLFISSAYAVKNVAIIQIIGHSSLDKVRRGIVDELAAAGYIGDNIHLQYENAQGNIVIAAQIAQQFVAERPDVIVAIATPSAQAVVNASKNTPVPIVFSSVTDPIQAKLVANLQRPGGHVTGTRNISPDEKQIHLIKNLLPNLKTLGIVLNYGEVNSVQLLQAMTNVARRYHITIKTAAAPTSGEVKAAAESLAPEVDAFLLLQDNTVAAALPAVLKTAQQYHRPVFAAYLDAVKAGALAGMAYDEYAIGRQTGNMVIKILHGADAGTMAVVDPAVLATGINVDTAQNLHISIPAHLRNESQLFYAPHRSDKHA